MVSSPTRSTEIETTRILNFVATLLLCSGKIKANVQLTLFLIALMFGKPVTLHKQPNLTFLA
jgi:hypothetical protein